MNGEIAEPKERHPIQKLTLTSDKVKGLDDITVDQEVEITVKVKCLKPLGHSSTWDKEDLKKPMEGEYEIISGSARSVDGEKMKKISKAGTIKELDEATEDD